MSPPIHDRNSKNHYRTVLEHIVYLPFDIHVKLFPVLITILRETKLAIIYNGFPIGYLCSIRSNLSASAQTCQLFENELMATLKRSKETNYDFIARIRFADHFNFKRYSMEREVI